MKKWLKSFFIFLIGFWFCGKLDFISLPSVLDCIVAYPHTKRKHATCVLDLILELAIHPVFSQNVGLQTSGGLLSHFCSGFLGSSLFSVLLLSTLSQILLHTPLSLQLALPADWMALRPLLSNPPSPCRSSGQMEAPLLAFSYLLLQFLQELFLFSLCLAQCQAQQYVSNIQFYIFSIF